MTLTRSAAKCPSLRLCRERPANESKSPFGNLGQAVQSGTDFSVGLNHPHATRTLSDQKPVFGQESHGPRVLQAGAHCLGAHGLGANLICVDQQQGQ